MFTDATCSAPSFSIKENLGTNPTASIPTEGAATGTVTPKPLPLNTLDFTR